MKKDKTGKKILESIHDPKNSVYITISDTVYGVKEGVSLAEIGTDIDRMMKSPVKPYPKLGFGSKRKKQ